jgi:hypothetical protein
MQLQLQFGNVLVVIFVLLLMLLFVILFSGILTPFFALYLMVLSNFSILLFNGRNVFSKILEMFNDLEDAPVEEPNSTSTFTRLKNFAFRKFHSIAVIFFLLLPTLIYNIREAVSKLKNADLIAGVVVINVVSIFIYSYLYSYHSAAIELFKILWDAVKEWVSPRTPDIGVEVNEDPVNLP